VNDSDSMAYVKQSNVSYTFRCSVSDIECISDEAKNKSKRYIKDQSMVGTWDIETFSFQPTGDVPLPERGFDSSGNEVDSVFMNCMTFHWKQEKNPMLRVCITTMATQPVPDALVILCEDQEELALAWGDLLGRMAPEFVIGFNDGNYDWPFMIERMRDLDRLNETGVFGEFIWRASGIRTDSPDNTQFILAGKDGEQSEEIKIDAETKVTNRFVHIPGCIPLDSCTINRKLAPNSEKWGLNFFLAKYGLELKEDMPYTTMFRVFALMWHFQKELSTKEFGRILSHVESLIGEHGESCEYFSSDEFPGSVYSISSFTLREIEKLVLQARDVGTYCVVDAQRCQELLIVKNVVTDFREMTNLSYTSMYDAVYRAGGMKVRNMAMAYGAAPEWNLSFCSSRKGVKTDKKYPGAFVVPPKKGLYRDHKRVKKLRAGKGPLIEEEGDKENRIPVDENRATDRPCTGLDFSSLYPSLIMAYNLSPEMVVFSDAECERLRSKGKKLLRVEFLYGEPGSKNKETVEGYIVQYTVADLARGEFEGIGLYPKILKELFEKRKLIKKDMGRYETAKEFLEKVFEETPEREIAAMKLEKQKKLVLEHAARNVAEVTKKLAETGKKYYKSKLWVAESVSEFLRSSWGCDDAGEYSQMSVSELFAEIEFKFNYFNSKQLALKVFMNTFYGETGNQLSPFFIVQVAGGITTMGQYNIKLVKSFVEENGYSVLYGDTDSLYLCCPEKLFREADEEYESGKTSKLEYWTKMVELTMEDLDVFGERVNNLLREDNGTRFLNMAYEEVLFPVSMVGKKKYIGVAHQGIVNFSICKAECTLAEFSRSKLLFIRGLEMKKRGGSEFMRMNCYKVWKDAFGLANAETLRQVVERTMKDILKTEWEPSTFARSKKYKLPQPGKPGNVSVLRFIDRMRHLERSRPELGIKCPEPGERFLVIIARKYPWVYNIQGTNATEVPVGDRMEFFSSLENEAYKRYLRDEVGCELEIDMDYYMTGEICGQFARFLLYHPDYDHYFQDWMYEDDEKYKEADKKAHDYAKKVLKDRYKKNHGAVYQKMNKIGQSVYNAVQRRVKGGGVYEELAAPQRRIFDMIQNELYSNKHLKNNADGSVEYKNSSVLREVREAIVEKAEAAGVRKAHPVCAEVAERLEMTVEQYYAKFYYVSMLDDKYGKPSAARVWSRRKRREYEAVKEEAVREITGWLGELSEMKGEHLNEMRKVIDKVKESVAPRRETMKKIAETEAEFDEEGRREILAAMEKNQEKITLDEKVVDEAVKEARLEEVSRAAELTELIFGGYLTVAACAKRIREINSEADWMKNKVAEKQAADAGVKRSERPERVAVSDDDREDYSRWCANMRVTGMFKGMI
jgi:DNA polymerase elongation subunit (family B)